MLFEHLKTITFTKNIYDNIYDRATDRRLLVTHVIVNVFRSGRIYIIFVNFFASAAS